MAPRDRALPIHAFAGGAIAGRRPDLRSMIDVAGGRTILAGLAVVTGLAILTVADARGLRLVWANAQWTVAALTATLASWQGMRSPTGGTSRVRRYLTLALGLCAAGQLCWDLLLVTGRVSLPSLADLLYLAVVAPIVAVLVLSTRGRLSAAEERTVYLDAATVLFSVVALIVTVGPAAGLVRLEPATALVLAYPVVILTSTGVGLVGTLANRSEVALRAQYAVLAGTLLVGVAYSARMVEWLNGAIPVGGPVGTPYNFILSVGLLIAGYGAATWNDVRDPRPAVDSADGQALTVLPLAAVSLSAALLVFDPGPDGALADAILHASVAASVVLLVLRQTLLVQERHRVFEEARTSHARRIEEIERFQGQLVAASRRNAVGELAGAVAHEVNNPLTGVLGYAELLLEQHPESDLEHEELTIIRDEALRARRIVRSLVEFTRPHAPERVPSDLNAVVRSTVDLLRYHVERGGTKIVERYEALPEVALDPNAIQQALLNLLTNATQAVSRGGTIEVATDRQGDEAVVTVGDDGVGMDDSVRGHALDPFFTTRGDGAAGLGLSVAAGLVEDHGGRLELDSAAGRGTVVRAVLPFVAPPASLARRTRPGVSTARATDRPGQAAGPTGRG